jgi:hypothetical protein
VFFSLKNIWKQSLSIQKKLSYLSVVTFRMMQVYEQGNQDILKVEVRMVFALAMALGWIAQ